MKSLWHIVAMISFVAFSTEAFAKKAKRDGFNFGTTLRLMETDQPSIATNAGGNSKRSVSDVQSVRPHLGYVFGGLFHLGVDAVIESEEREEALNGLNANEKIESSRSSSLNGAGLVARFLFGQVMYFQTGIGYYDRKDEVVNKYATDLGSGQFSGRKEELTSRAVGAGYHLGGGIELPVAAGFYVSANYLVQTFELKPYKESSSIKRDSDRESRQELSFGIVHYYD